MLVPDLEADLHIYVDIQVNQLSEYLGLFRHELVYLECL